MKSVGPLFLLLIFALITGCASYDASVPTGATRATRYFVLSNGNDNRTLDRQIVEALRARGFTADFGPLTMMPDETQAVVTYQDNWSWDFGDHLVFLQISARDRKSQQPMGTVTFRTKLPTRKPTSGIVDELVTKLLSGQKS